MPLAVLKPSSTRPWKNKMILTKGSSPFPILRHSWNNWRVEQNTIFLHTPHLVKKHCTVAFLKIDIIYGDKGGRKRRSEDKCNNGMLKEVVTALKTRETVGRGSPSLVIHALKYPTSFAWDASSPTHPSPTWKTNQDTTSWIMAAATAYVTPVHTSSACRLLVSTFGNMKYCITIDYSQNHHIDLKVNTKRFAQNGTVVIGKKILLLLRAPFPGLNIDFKLRDELHWKWYL